MGRCVLIQVPRARWHCRPRTLTQLLIPGIPPAALPEYHVYRCAGALAINLPGGTPGTSMQLFGRPSRGSILLIGHQTIQSDPPPELTQDWGRSLRIRIHLNLAAGAPGISSLSLRRRAEYHFLRWQFRHSVQVLPFPPQHSIP